ncbi:MULTISPECIES: hypothetical protein [Nostocales]|uniref:Uncharacterized protein n=1 Tax=Dolichospermum flos-aquae UHCC 0037 TaxID=2590026 RepID=A0ACC7SD24_DOLFA|nr:MULTISPECIES: hypothetical protein [Nostocales]MBO1067529.1 hypothetical protein [Anabaena sp. 54]MTJ46335.1 hypothetical protein [Dolichospermum flos-aquae UHCC 0037]OBQ17026.1 MAG: hypothetical protein AN486_16670 [Anabaena sp. AL93]
MTSIMSDTQWQKEITSLKKDLNSEISKIERASEITIPQYICINNLKSKLERLEKIERILSIDKYNIVFIGTIGKGKTTAICHLFNLISEFNVSKTMSNGKTKNVIETKELLSTGSGKTTICEVILKASEKTYIEIEPYTVAEMENLIYEFCDSIASKDNIHSEEKIIISEEIQRAIRNVTELKINNRTVYEGDKKTIIRNDKAKELFEQSKEELNEELRLEMLKKTALDNANLESRTTTLIEFDHQNNEQAWIKDTFHAINNVELKEFAIPRKIYLYVSNNVLSGSNLYQFNSVVDTKGIDENPIRKDLQKYIENQDTICLFVTPFTDAPDASIRKLIAYHLASKSKDFHHRFVTLVLPRKNEPQKVHGADDNWDIGVQIRKEEIQTTFKHLNLDFFLENILFYDSLRYYRDDIVKLHEIFDEEDVQADKNQFIKDIAGVIERRRNILLDEIKDIQASFVRIKNGDALTETEINAIENAIQKIKDIRDLSKRVPAFVYEDFINEYIGYYRTTYKAWNTKHAIHRNYGYYEPRDIDIYYDAKVVAEGIDENAMLKKFTKEVKQELEDILNNLISANESLKTFIPELINQFYMLYYKDFINEVGTEMEAEFNSKLSPQNEDSPFWNSLITQKGRPTGKGETYTGNVCLLFTRELEKETDLNAVLKSKTEYHWEKLIIKILEFFGQK